MTVIYLHRIKSLRKVGYSFLGIALLFLFLAKHLNLPYSKERLKLNYLKNLKSYEGTLYYWGGENFMGIDCSGLPRKSMMNALLKESFRSFSFQAFTQATDLWVYDSSANALKQEYRNRIRRIIKLSSVKKTTKQLIPGDMAVTSDGIHVLIFIDKNQWLQADPTLGVVHLGNPTRDHNNWYDTPIDIMRWSYFF